MAAPRRSSLARLLPMAVVAVAGLTLGILFAGRGSGPDPETTAADGPVAAAARDPADIAAEEAELAALQERLARTQLLPSDFRTVPPFTLVGTDGEPLTEGVLEDRWSLMFFGFTNCPDVCPVTLSVMKDVVAELEERDVEPMQVVFVTVDPARDTVERMAEYIPFFDPDFVGVTGELGEIHALTRELGIVAAFTANDEQPDAYVVDHTASMLLVDPERRVRAKFTAPHQVDTIVADYAAIRAAFN